LTLGSAVRRKGVLGGAVHTALDFIPFVGGFKNVAEVARGRDFVPDKRPATVSAAAQPASPPFKTNGGTRS
jgi:hypothetical protein